MDIVHLDFQEDGHRQGPADSEADGELAEWHTPEGLIMALSIAGGPVSAGKKLSIEWPGGCGGWWTPSCP